MLDYVNQPIFWLLIAALAAAPVTVILGTWKTRLTVPTALVMTLFATATVLWGWHSGSRSVDLAWSTAWDIRFTFELDGLAVLYALLATGVGAVIVLYAGRYIPLHLHHMHRPDGDIVPFFGWLLTFMGSMIGLVLARDLVLIFVFWDLTAIASFFLIGYDRKERDARSAAFMALVTTGGSAIAFLVAIMLIHRETGSFSLDVALSSLSDGRTATVAALLIALAGLAKSAQTPLHFWLPRAMAAPTPVSAYLHSAAMVAAGVFLLSRFHPILELSDGVMRMLEVVGFASMVIGGTIALTRDRLKQILAYSTISQYGYVVLLLGMNNDYAPVAASFYVVAHAIAKSALFLTAGTITEATGTALLSENGGLWRKMPVLAISSGIAAASLAAIPGTSGFFKDELFFAAGLQEGGSTAYISVIGVTLTFAYMGRFWIGLFLGKQRAQPKPLSGFLTWPIAALGVLSIVGGFWYKPMMSLAEGAGLAISGVELHPHIGYARPFTREQQLAAVAIIAGTTILFAMRWIKPRLLSIVSIGERIGPEHLFVSSIAGLNRASNRAYQIEVRDLRSRIASILPPVALLVGMGLFFSRDDLQVRVGPFERHDLVIAIMLAVASLAALAASAREHHLTLSLVLSGVGFSLAVVYALLGAPDVALVAVLVETIFTLLFLGMVSLMPGDVDRGAVQRGHEDEPMPDEPNRSRDIAIAMIGGALAFVVAWTALSQNPTEESIGTDYLNLTPLAHGTDVVTVILADFRGFDTMGEITVIGIAFLGIATLLRRWRTRR